MKGLASLLAAASCAALPLAAQTPLRVGQTVAGALEAGDPRTEDGAHYDTYVIQGRPGDRVVVRMRSPEFDALLRYGRAGGDGAWEETLLDDDSGDGTNARLAVTLDGDGAYQLRATSFSEDELGAYEISVAEPRVVPPGRIAVGQTVEAELTQRDTEGDEGLEDHYLLQGRAGGVATVFAESDVFDTYLVLAAEDGGELVEVLTDDDGGVGTNSQMVVEFEEDREYHVIVRSFLGEGEGPYTVRVQAGAAEPVEEEEMMDVPELRLQGETVGPVTAGRDTRGTLDGASDDEGWTLFHDDYTYRARAGERLVIQVTSGVLDSYVLIGRGEGDDFEPLAEDDDGGMELNSRLEFEVPEDGEYTIRVTTAAPDERGDYVLRVDTEG